MKKTFLAVAICFVHLFAFAQTTTTTTTVTTTKTVITTSTNEPTALRPIGSELSIGLETGLALGQLKDISSFGVGGTIKYAYNFDESMAVTFQSGYIDFISKNVNPRNDGSYSASGKTNTSQIPFKAGFRYSIGRFYFEPQLGVSIIRQKLVDYGTSNSTSAFTFAANIGVLATRNFDMSVRYEGMSRGNGSLVYLALRLAYSLPLSKK